MKFTENYSYKILSLKNELVSADSVVIGAGAGLSTSAGFTYSGERFEKYFSDFGSKYGFSDMYSGGFYPYVSPEVFWAYWSRYILCNRYIDIDHGTYKLLFDIVKDKYYFVITTNVDHLFRKAGFDKERLFYTQGDYGLFQCSEPCHNKTYDNEEIIKDMIEFQSDMKIPNELIPKCPKCGRPMTTNLRCDDKFVEDDGWHNAAKRYNDFIKSHRNAHILFLELGIGSNTPAIIKYPFRQMTLENKNSIYACINYGEAYAPEDIADRAVCINSDIKTILQKLSVDTSI